MPGRLIPIPWGHSGLLQVFWYAMRIRTVYQKTSPGRVWSLDLIRARNSGNGGPSPGGLVASEEL